MAHTEQREFCEKVKNIYPEYFKNKKVLDIGSLDINGSNRTLFEDCEYIGLDVGEGKNVNVVSVGHLYDAPDNYFDTIISTEVFEHDMFYKETIANVIRMLKPGGLFLFTCASIGRPEHGTRRTGGFDAPLLIQISEEWADYYKNLTEKDFREIQGFNKAFSDSYFEFKNTNIEIPSDLYFYGIKGGSKYLTKDVKQNNTTDIFIINSWIDNETKENNLINLINRIKSYGIPILLTGHYPVKSEIQNMVDYYLYDKNNPLLLYNEFNEYGVNSVRWTEFDDIRIENKRKFHHDYAIWEIMRLSFKFCENLGKKNIHFMEYDNLPDLQQFRQSFIEYLPHFDAVIYEYHKGSSNKPNPYCSTYIFSIKTDIAIKTIDSIKTKEEFFKNKPDKWQLEKNFYQTLKSITSNIKVSDYIPNNNELNLQSVWSGERKNNTFIEIYLSVDKFDNLYIHPISGTGEKKTKDDYLLEIVYGEYKKFHTLQSGQHNLHLIGKYNQGMTVHVYQQGFNIFKEFLINDVKKFREFNNLTILNDKTELDNYEPKQVNINFIEGAFVEILGDDPSKYEIKFINSKNGEVIYETIISNNQWCKTNLTYYVDWEIQIKGIGNTYKKTFKFNPKDNKIFISFETKSLGDTIAFIPYVEEFRKKRNCKVVCSTFHNNLFETKYPNIEFVNPGSVSNNVSALYRLGLFYTNNEIDYNKHPSNPIKEPLQKIASDILGLEFKEIKPLITTYDVKKKKQVCIAIHSTAQAKYWNNPKGWQQVVDYLKLNGYEVILLSKEEDGYMGNKNPIGVIQQPPSDLKTIIKTLQESEFFIGISSGLSWLAWASGIPVILISGFTDAHLEPFKNIERVINKNVCNGCWHTHKFDPGDWNWCPIHKNTDRQFECSKEITSEDVIKKINKFI